MRQTLLWAAAAGIAALVLVPGTSTADATGLALASGAPLRLTGDVVAESAHAWLLGTEQPTPVPSAGPVQIVRTDVATSYQRLPSGDLVALDRVATTHRAIVDAAALDVAPQDAHWWAALADDVSLTIDGPTAAPADAWHRAHTQVSVLLQPQAFIPSASSPLPPVVAQTDIGAHAPAGWVDLRADATQAAFTASRILVYGAAVSFEGAQWTAGTTVREAPGSIPVAGTWTGPGSHVEETSTLIEFRPLEPSAVHTAGPVHLYTDDLRLSLAGTAAFPWAEGKLVADDGSDLWLSGDQLVVAGDVDLRLLAASVDGAPTLHWLGGGRLAAVQVGPAADGTTTTEAAAVAAAATAGAAAVAAAVWYWPLLRWAATGLLAPLYARVPRERVLDHGARELVYERIKREPGVSTHRLAAEVDFGWSTLAYHLRVLERNQLIVSVRDGRYRRYFDRESGLYANGRKYVVAALRNDTTLALARAVLAQPGLTQKDLSERFQLSPSSVHWHVERLADVGLVDKRRDGHHVRHWPGPAWDQIQDADLAGSLASAPAPTSAAVPGLALPLAPSAPDA